jgi:hypothetical protein
VDYEGCDGPLNLKFYDPVPGDMIPNDDLDLQVLWACVMDEMEAPFSGSYDNWFSNRIGV